MAPSMRPANCPNRSYPAFGQELHLAPRCTVLTSTTSNTRWHRLNGRSNWGNGFPSPLSKARAQEQLWVLVPLPTVTVFCSSFPYLGRGLYISWISPSRSGPEHTYLLVSRQIHSPSSSLLLQALLGPYSGLYRPGETLHQSFTSGRNFQIQLSFLVPYSAWYSLQLRKTQLLPNQCPQFLDSYQSSHNKTFPLLCHCFVCTKTKLFCPLLNVLIWNMI